VETQCSVGQRELWNNKNKMPEVRAGETEDQYLKRCIPEVIDEGASPDQAVAICIAKYNKERDTYEGQFKQEHVLYHKAFHNIRESFVKKYTRKTVRALKDMLTPVFDANTVDEMRGVNLNQKPLDDLFLDLYTTVGSTFAKVSYNNLKQHMALETKQAPDFVERMATFASTGHDRTRVIALNQGKEIQRLIGKALEEELGIVQAGERVKELVTQNINTYQAERIARTEILSASNFGSVEGAKSTGLPLMKQWISVLGDSTRNGHSTAHGTVVDLYDENGGDGVFEVGGEFLRFAGDPNGRPDNIINCRCTQVFLTKEEALGEQAEQEEEEQEATAQQQALMQASEVKDRNSFVEYMDQRGFNAKGLPRNIEDDGFVEMAKQHKYLMDTFGEDPESLRTARRKTHFRDHESKRTLGWAGYTRAYEGNGFYKFDNAHISLNNSRAKTMTPTQQLSYWKSPMQSQRTTWNEGQSYLGTYLHEMIHHYDYTYSIRKHNKGSIFFGSYDSIYEFNFTSLSKEIEGSLIKKYGKEEYKKKVSTLGEYALWRFTKRASEKYRKTGTSEEVVTLAFQKKYTGREDDFVNEVVEMFIKKYNEAKK